MNSDVFFTFVLFFLAVPCVSYFFGFCSFHFATFFVTTNVFVFCFRCFLVILLHSRVSRHFKRVPCLFLAVHMSHFYVFSIFWHLYSHFARSSSLLSTFFSMCFSIFPLLLVLNCDFSSLLVVLVPREEVFVLNLLLLLLLLLLLFLVVVDIVDGAGAGGFGAVRGGNL